jgi:antirestriction protein ArdC
MARSPHKARSRRKLTDAEREQRRRRDRERLAEAIRELLSSEGWQAWLRTRATLHGYSLRNTYLIAQEARRRGFEPTHVAGFRAWLKLGRVVRKGEPGLAILAPVTVKRREPDGAETGERRTFFRTVHVWDLSQTTSLPGVEPAPLAAPRQPLSGDSHVRLLEPLERLAAELGYDVSYRPLRGVEGLCEFRARRISIETGLAGNARVATLVHELGHALIDRELDGHGRLDKRVEELIVEAVAYVALAAAGLDTAPDSVPYIASWEGDDALEQLQRTVQLIDALARRIEQTMAPQEQAEQRLALRDAC